jgi:hypothetical protein
MSLSSPTYSVGTKTWSRSRLASIQALTCPQAGRDGAPYAASVRDVDDSLTQELRMVGDLVRVALAHQKAALIRRTLR